MPKEPEERPVSGDVIPGPPGKIRLKSADDVRVEMARVYREMRRGELHVNTGTKLIYALTAIGKLVEQAEFEKRLSALEALEE